MRRQRRGLRITPGLAPGTLRIPPDASKPVIDVIGYGPDGFEEKPVADPKRLASALAQWPVTWVNVVGLGDEATLRAVAETFNLHRLALEDVVDTGQRPKVEPFEDHLFIVLRYPHADGSSEQIAVFLGANSVLVFQERPGDCFAPLRERVRNGKGLLRRSGADYLAYALLDAVIDSYFPALERAAQQLHALEDTILASPDNTIVGQIRVMKSDLQELQRIAWLHHDVAHMLIRSETKFITEGTKLYLRDCADHAEHVKDVVAAHRDAAADLMNAYLSSMSIRMNEVMKVLTIIASIFIPLSFVAGIYGMNFNTEASRFNMPELNWVVGYPVALGLMGIIAAGLLFYFRKKRWL
jgi:magnesium transporter